MAFKAKLQLGEKEYDALDCHHSFHRDTDEKGRPVSNSELLCFGITKSTKGILV